jgi:hypothetical protein
MTSDERQDRLNLFLVMAEELPTAKQTIDNVFRLVCKYDVPKHTDRQFIYDCLIIYYSNLEEYEKCAELLKFKQESNRRKKITAKGLTRMDLADLRLLGFQVPDIVALKVLSTSGSINDSRAGK